MLVDYLKANHPHIKKLIYFPDGCGGQYKNYKDLMDLCFHEHDFGISAEWVFFATSFSAQAVTNLPVMALVEQLNNMKRSEASKDF